MANLSSTLRTACRMPRFTSKRCETDAGVPTVTVRKPELGELDGSLRFQNRPSGSPGTHGQGAGSHAHCSPRIKTCSCSKPQEEEKGNHPGVAPSCRVGARPAARLRVPPHRPGAGHMEVAAGGRPCGGCVWGSLCFVPFCSVLLCFAFSRFL